MPRRPSQRRSLKRTRGNDGGAVIIPVMERFASKSLPHGQRITLEPASFTNRGIFANGKQSKSYPLSMEVVGDIENPFCFHAGGSARHEKEHRLEDLPPTPSSALSAYSLQRRRQGQAQTFGSDASHDIWTSARVRDYSTVPQEAGHRATFEESRENRMWPAMRPAPATRPDPIESQKQRSDLVPSRPSIDDLIEACEKGYFGDDCEREQGVGLQDTVQDGVHDAVQDGIQDAAQDAVQHTQLNDTSQDNDNPSLGHLANWLQEILEPSEFKEDRPEMTTTESKLNDTLKEQQTTDYLNDHFHDNALNEESHPALISPKSSRTSAFNQSNFSSLLLGEALYTPSSVTSIVDSLQLPFDFDTRTLLLDDDCTCTGTVAGHDCGPESLDQSDPVGKWFWKTRAVPIS